MNVSVDLTDAQWVKSSLSGGSGDNCLEVSFISGLVALRDSKDVGDPDARALFISEEDYSAFIGGVARGELQPPAPHPPAAPDVSRGTRPRPTGATNTRRAL